LAKNFVIFNKSWQI